MVRQLLILAGLAVGTTAFAATRESAAKVPAMDQMEGTSISVKGIPTMQLDLNSYTLKGMPMQKAPAASIQWKRPAGQFWGTGLRVSTGQWYAFTPLVLRPWIDYTFENISTGVSGEPTWSLEVLTNPETASYETQTSHDQDVTMSYLRNEVCAAPALSYGNSVPFPSLFYRSELIAGADGQVKIAAESNVANVFGDNMPLCSHFYSLFTLDDEYSQGLTWVNGLGGYEGMAENEGLLFGTNSWGYNAAANRFEKPENPYLLNSVYWVYMSSGAIPKDIPLTCYVFKTDDPDAQYNNGQNTFSGVSLGDLIAVSHAVVPASAEETDGAVKFEFVEKNPVTGAESQVSLEISDDITIVVTGFDVDLGNGQRIGSMMSLDNHDSGYGNMGFMGGLDMTEDGAFDYFLLSLTDMMEMNTVSGILIDATYPWLFPYFTDQPDDVMLPNDGETTEEVQGLDYYLYLMSTSETSDFDVTFNGEDECDWLSITDVFDDYQDYYGEGEEFTGITGLVFTATPNPNDEDRTCKVEVSIPCASYVITFRQGSNNAVDVIGVEGDAQYFDLQGRRVANPDKGIYIKKSGNKTSKVIL